MTIQWSLDEMKKTSPHTGSSIEKKQSEPISVYDGLPIVYQQRAQQVDMRRIVIIGSSGSGKSTLARQLGNTLNLPVIHLDKYFWHPGWVGTDLQEWIPQVEQFAAGSSWIIDGNYRSTLDIRLKRADTVIFLDLPRWVCVWRAIKRRFQYLNRQRPDVAEGCQEKVLDPAFPQFLHWVWNYPNRARPVVLRTVKRLPDEKRFIWLKSTAEVGQFLTSPWQWPGHTTDLNGLNDFFASARFDG
jgi:adenylate kinase family enzyme